MLSNNLLSRKRLKRSEVLPSLLDTQQSFRSETDSNISVVTCNNPGEPPSFYSSHMRTSDIADASVTSGSKL
jgi:hypothetical protein